MSTYRANEQRMKGFLQGIGRKYEKYNGFMHRRSETEWHLENFAVSGSMQAPATHPTRSKLLRSDRLCPWLWKPALTIEQMFFWSQVLALGSVGTGRLTSAVLRGQVLRGQALEKQSEWRLASWSWMWPCLCGLWVVAEVMLATIRCGYGETGSRFVCPAEVSPSG